MYRLCLFCVVFIGSASQNLFSQTTHYSLPAHKGAMVLDLDGLHLTQQSAKPDGREIGVRAHDASHTELLAFLFLTPEFKKQTPATCLEQDLKQIRKDNGKFGEKPNPFNTDGSDFASILVTYPSGNQVLYKYAGTGDQCLLVQVYADKGSKLDLAMASTLLGRQHYDPKYVPATDDVARYQGIQGAHMLASSTLPAVAPRMLVSWYAPGGIPLPSGSDWKLELLTAYDKAGRPTAEFKNSKSDVIASFIISENVSGKPTAEGCRKDVLEGIQKSDSGPLLSNQVEGEMNDGHGGAFATASHFTHITATSHNHDVFAFAGDKNTCAEIHVSTVSGKPDEDMRLADALAEFHPDLLYGPTCSDYVAQASVFYTQSPMMAAPFYDSCLNTIPADTKDPDLITTRRIATDQVVIALGSSGDIKRSRMYAERAIKIDPDYPINYYNLACADAEQGRAADAQLHLQQAFDRRAKVISGEKMPDPAQDDSIQKLKNDKEFWAFVQTLPKS